MDYIKLAEKILAGGKAGRKEALGILRSGDDSLHDLLYGAFALRRAFFGRGVRLHVIRNARSGACGEDCAYCAQSAKSRGAGVKVYDTERADSIISGAEEAVKNNASRYCIVTSGRELSEESLAEICRAVAGIKRRHNLKICVSPGMLDSRRAALLKAAGADRVNHNLETSENYFPKICSSHSFADRVSTAAAVKAAGMELCSGGIIGMGESPEDRVELALALRGLGADAVPVNFYDPRPGARLRPARPLGAADALRALAMFRFVNPDREIRAAGGRERVLGPAQPLALYAADSMFTKGYLTTPGQGLEADLRLIETAGFKLRGVD